MSLAEGEKLAYLRFKQLEKLVDRSLDKPVVWEEIQAVKTPFLSSYTYENKPVKVQAGPELNA